MSFTTNIHEIKTLISSFHPLLVIDYPDEERVTQVLDSVGIQLKLPVFEWTVTEGLRRSPDVESTYETKLPMKALEYIDDLRGEFIFLMKDFSKQLEDPIVERKFKELIVKFAKGRSTFVLTGGSCKLNAELEAKAIFYNIEFPSEDELRLVVKNVVQSLVESKKIKIEIEKSDLHNIVSALRGMTSNQARQSLAYSILVDGKLSKDTLKFLADRKAKVIREGGLLEYFPAEDNRYELGGFENLKKWLDRAKMGFSKEAKDLNLAPPKGILLVGVQGCGKSLCARVVSRAWNIPLLKLDAGRFYDKYIGESEKNLERATSMAEAMAPAVLFIDEIEKAITQGDSSMDGGVSSRLFGAFLTWLQDKRDAVFVVATANDISRLPPEFIRKGRFDEIFFVDLPNLSERVQILKIHLKLRKQLVEEFDLEKLARASEGFSGAELEQAIVAALYQSLYTKCKLSTELIIKEIQGTRPLSVSRKEDIEKLRAYAKERFISVS